MIISSSALLYSCQEKSSNQEYKNYKKDYVNIKNPILDMEHEFYQGTLYLKEVRELFDKNAKEKEFNETDVQEICDLFDKINSKYTIANTISKKYNLNTIYILNDQDKEMYKAFKKANHVDFGESEIKKLLKSKNINDVKVYENENKYTAIILLLLLSGVLGGISMSLNMTLPYMNNSKKYKLGNQFKNNKYFD